MSLASSRSALCTWTVSVLKRNLLRHVRERRLLQRTRLFLSWKRIYSYTSLRAGSSLHKSIFFKCSDECVSVWVSVREWYAIVCLLLFSIQAASSHFSVLSSHSFQQFILSLRHQQRPARASSVTDSWMVVLTWASGILRKQGNPPYIRASLCLWMTVSGAGGILAAWACREYEERTLLRLWWQTVRQGVEIWRHHL